MNIDKMTEFCKVLELKDADANINHLHYAVKLMEEEVCETNSAIHEYEDTWDDKSFVAEDIMDGFGDVAFIALNGIYKTFRMLGVGHDVAKENITIVMNRICDANFTKLQEDGTVKYNKQGKVQKPIGWKAPEYSDLIP